MRWKKIEFTIIYRCKHLFDVIYYFYRNQNPIKLCIKLVRTNACKGVEYYGRNVQAKDKGTT